MSEGRPYVVQPGNAVSARMVLAQVYTIVVAVLLVGVGAWRVLDGGGLDVLAGVLLAVAGLVIGARSVVWLVRLPQLRAARMPAQVALDDEGVSVNLAAHARGARARLAWDRCAAVVASPVPVQPQGPKLYYVHFLPRTEGDVELLGVDPDELISRAAATGLDPVPSATAWVLVAPHLPLARDLLAEVGRRRPELRVVDSIRH